MFKEMTAEVSCNGWKTSPHILLTLQNLWNRPSNVALEKKICQVHNRLVIKSMPSLWVKVLPVRKARSLIPI